MQYPDCRDDDATGHIRQSRQYLQALRNDVLMRRETVPGECFPLHEMNYRNRIVREETNLRFELIRMPRILGQDEQRSLLFRRNGLGELGCR